MHVQHVCSQRQGCVAETQRAYVVLDRVEIGKDRVLVGIRHHRVGDLNDLALKQVKVFQVVIDAILKGRELLQHESGVLLVGRVQVVGHQLDFIFEHRLGVRQSARDVYCGIGGCELLLAYKVLFF